MSQNISFGKNWVIFDTCAVSKIVILDKATPILTSIRDKIGEFTAVITPVIRFEFLRSSNSKEEFEKFKNYLLSNYIEIDLKSEEDRFDIYNLSSELACIYRYVIKQHYKNIGIADFVHAGLLRRYPSNLYLLTFDIHDFPEPIFETVHHESIKVNNSLEIWMLCKFNKAGFASLYQTFKQ